MFAENAVKSNTIFAASLKGQIAVLPYNKQNSRKCTCESIVLMVWLTLSLVCKQTHQPIRIHGTLAGKLAPVAGAGKRRQFSG